VEGSLVLQGHYSQHSPFEFRNDAPKAKPVVFLGFHTDWIFKNSCAPLLLQIRSFPENLILEIIRELESDYDRM
jgi:hypothetical protein